MDVTISRTSYIQVKIRRLYQNTPHLNGTHMFFYLTPTSLKHNQVAVDRTILYRTRSE